MKIKKGVIMPGISIKMRLVMLHADKIWKHHSQELVITSALDGTHSARSLHYYGLALDLRTRYFDTATVKRIALKLKAALNRDYDVVVHKSHIHVEYDPGV